MVVCCFTSSIDLLAGLILLLSVLVMCGADCGGIFQSCVFFVVDLLVLNMNVIISVNVSTVHVGA